MIHIGYQLYLNMIVYYTQAYYSHVNKLMLTRATSTVKYIRFFLTGRVKGNQVS